MTTVFILSYPRPVAVVFALSTVLSTFLGGLFALRNRGRLHLVLGFTAGVMLGLVAFDLLPEVFSLAGQRRVLGVPTVMVTFAAGFLVLHVVERSAALHTGHEDNYGAHRHPNVGVLGSSALVAHSFLDGLGIGLAFQASTAVGITVAIAVIGHDFADGINTVGVMTAHHNNHRRTVAMLIADALAPAVGVATTLVVHLPSSTLGLYLGFFAGFLLYLATGDILPEAHSRNPTPLTLVATMAGIGFMWTVVGLS
jgi:zinc transporter ZupT